ncbi:hypothetical protein D9613_004832 [Agrocybe pediades]|uniref:Uncharacterized protein n=1 Tax=Agrocybe pediades TaxID=84607 RepID=A0A8H4QX68_9AGAR|nr:hypothetical protein D9613_004832 [Agrocybe pediades]
MSDLPWFLGLSPALSAPPPAHRPFPSWPLLEMCLETYDEFQLARVIDDSTFDSRCVGYDIGRISIIDGQKNGRGPIRDSTHSSSKSTSIWQCIVKKT